MCSLLFVDALPLQSWRTLRLMTFLKVWLCPKTAFFFEKQGTLLNIAWVTFDQTDLNEHSIRMCIYSMSHDALVLLFFFFQRLCKVRRLQKCI